MAMTDVELSVGLVPGDIKKTASELGRSIKEIFESSAGKPLDASMQKLQQQMSRNASEAQKLINKMTELESKKIPTDEYKEIEKQIQRDTAALAKLGDKIEAFRDSGKDTKSDTFMRMTVQADELRNSIDYAKGELQDLVDTGKAFTLGSGTAEYDRLNGRLAELNNRNRIAINSWNEHSNAVQKTTNSYKGLNIGIGSGIKKLLKYAFGIASITVLFNKFRAAAMEGIKALVQWEGENGKLNKSISSLQSSIATLKNNIGALVEPLINVLAPVLTKIIDLISIAIQKIAMFIAMLTGAKTIKVANKVQSNYAASLDKTAKGAKKAEKALKGYLSPLDEINKFESQKDNEDAGGGGGGGAAGPSFSEVPIDPNMFKWLDKLQSLINYLKKLWGAFKQGFFEGLGDWEPRVARLKQGLSDIWTALKDIWTDPRVLGAADRYLTSLAHMLGALAGSVASIGLTIATNLVAGIGNYLRDNTERIKQYLIDMFNIGAEINDLLATLFTDIAYIFEAFASENGIRITAAIIGIFSDAFMGITELVAKFGRDLLNLIVKPLEDNKEHIRQSLEDTFGYIADIFETVKADVDYVFDEINKAYDEHLKPLFDDLASGISVLVSTFMDAYDKYIKPVWDKITQGVSEFSEKYFRPMIDALMRFLNPLIDLIRLLWNNILQPLLAWFVDNFVRQLATKIEFMWNIIQYAFRVISLGVTTALNVLGSLLQFVVDIFTVGWDKAWENLKNNFIEIWETIKSQVIGIVNSMIDIINSMIDMIGDALNGLLSGINAGLSWLAEHGGPNWGKVSLVDMPHIPHLAQGAVIPPNKEFMAVLGDQTSGTNIETPLSTMVEAFNIALKQNGGVGGVKQINFLLPDRRTLAQYTISGGRIIQTSTGKNPFELA